MVASDENRQNRSHLLAAVVLVERAHILELPRHGHALEILHIARGLKVAAAQQQIDGAILAPFEFGDRFVDLLQFAVRTTLDGDFHPILALKQFHDYDY